MSHGIAYRYSMMDNWIMYIIFKEIKQPKHPGRLDCTASEKKEKKKKKTYYPVIYHNVIYRDQI